MNKITRTLTNSNTFSHVYIGATHATGLPQVERIDDKRTVVRASTLLKGSNSLSKALMLIEWYIKIAIGFRKTRLAAVSCHSLSVLPLGVIIKRLHKCHLIYDTHELETETQASTGWRRRVMKTLERRLLPSVDEIVVVNESIAEWYREMYGREVVVVRNVPETRTKKAVAPGQTLKEALGLPADAILFLYQGLIVRGRAIPQLIEAFTRLNDVKRSIVFLGNGEMLPLVQTAARVTPNIHHLPPVPPDEVLSLTGTADVGISLIENTCRSYYLSLPNKFLEYISVAVPPIASDFPEMAAIVTRWNCGWVIPPNAHDIEELARSITRREVDQKSMATAEAAKEFSWEEEASRIVDMYGRLQGSRE